MLSATFNAQGIGADDPDFSVDLNRSTATIRIPEILYIIHRNCYTSQGDPDFSFPYLQRVTPWLLQLSNSGCEVTLFYLSCC